MVSFECDNSNIMEELSGLGKLVQKVVSIDYSCKLKPLLSMCEIGNAKEQLCNSHGLCVDNNNGNIYVADQLNNCVLCFFLFKFGDTDDEGFLYGEPSLILVYDKEGKFVLIVQVWYEGERRKRIQSPLLNNI